MLCNQSKTVLADAVMHMPKHFWHAYQEEKHQAERRGLERRCRLHGAAGRTFQRLAVTGSGALVSASVQRTMLPA
jgi:hypothetical protein